MDADDQSMNSEVTMPMRGIAALGRIDQYELVSELGGGGFGTVYLAKDTVSGVEVAVKGLPPFVKNNREEMENIRANFALVSRLHHPNIAAALVLHPAKSVTYASEAVRQKLRVLPGDTLMVMEYAPGVTLSQWRKQFPERRVPIDKALEITRQIASALDYAHERKIIHRDIKPANVMIETAADGAVTARVLDFGLAAEIRSSMGRVSQEIHDTSGTRPYMAPEQWLGGKQGPATDQYALAVLFNELVTGDVPFASVFETGDPVVMMNVVGSRPFTPPPDLPKPERRALSRALAKKPEERFASCGEFVAALEGRCASAPPQSGGPRPVAAKGILAAALLAALAGGGYFAWMKYDAQAKAREAEVARVRQEVYELKGKASQAREKNAKEDWHNWPQFSLKAKELEGAFRAGEAALEKDDYAVARVQFLKVRDNWYWLSSNKVVRAEAEAMRAKVETARQSADSARVAEFDTEGFATATNDMEVASRMLEDGDFSGALSAFRKASSAFEVAISSAKTKIAIKAEADRKAKEAAEKRAAELRAEAERRAKEEAEKAALSAKKAEEVVWQNCLKLKIQTTDEERADITDALSFDCRRGWFHYNSFEDCRKADWNDPYVLYLLGKHAGRRSDNWEADEQLELAFYKKSIELGCTNAIPDVKKLKWKLSVKPYFDVIKADDLNKIKQIINETNPCIGMTNSSGRTLMYWAALYADAKVLAYLDSIGHAYNIEDKSGETPLFAACANTNGTRAVSCLEWLVAKGADINARNYKASEYSNPYPILGVRTLQAFNYLIDKGAKTDVKGDHGNTLLHRVARFADDFGLVSKVVSLFGEVDIRNEEGMTPLHYAAYGHSDCADRIIELLVDKGADVRAKVSAGYHKGYQPIHLLASDSVSLARDKERSKRCIYALCRSGADVDAYTSIDGKLYEGVTPLMLAAKEGNVAAVEALLAHGADASLRSKKYNEGYMALHMVEGDKQDACLIVEKLCVKGCKIDVPVSGNRYYSGHTLLHLVCGGHEYGIRTRRLIRAILARGASKERRTTGGTYDGYTALGLACEQVNFSAVKVLLESGCAVSAFSGKDGEQAIHIIAKKDYSYLYKGRPMYRVEDVIKCLVDHGANVNAQLTGAQYSFKRGLTPLHVAADCSTPAPVELLIKYGANVNLTDDAGRTPLWLACDVSSRNKKVKVRHIKILLAHGANPNHRDKKGVTLLSQVKDGDVRKLLMDALNMVGHNSSTKQFIDACKAKEYVAAAGLMNSVDLNDAVVQFYFGLMYANGHGVTKDWAEAVKWYRKSAEQGDKDAQNNLGNMYANGRGVAKDEVEAVRWYRKAADQKDSFAQFNLGVMYGNGRGVARDDVEAVKWFRKAAEQGNVRAQREMGWRYQKGSGVVQNLALAVEWYRKAADQGYSVAQFDLGVMYKNGWGVAKDEAEAAKWYRKAEENGYKKPKPKTASLSSAAQKLVGSWSCYCSVTYHDSLGSRADDRIKRYLPVSSTIRLTCREDGTVKLSDSSGRTFGESSGRWQYRHGMLLMDLEANDGRKFRLSGVVNWRGESFELHYDNGEYANMLQMKCQNEITDINAVLSSYVNGQMEVSISTKAPSFKNGAARCSAHVFSRL